MSIFDYLKKLNRKGKRSFMRKLKVNNRAKTKGAFGRGPFEKYDNIKTARSATK